MKKLFYFLSLLTFVTTGCGKFTLDDVQNNLIATPKPTVRAVTSNSITVNLDSNAVASNYELLWNTTNSVVGGTTIYHGTNHTPITITGLLAGKTIFFFERIEASQSHEYSLWGGSYGTTSGGIQSTKKTLAVFIGDSKTHGGDLPTASSYPSQFQVLAGSGIVCYNLGVNGASVGQFSSQVTQAISLKDTALYNQNIAYIEGSTNDNDSLSPASSTYAQMSSNVASLIAGGFKVIVLTTIANNSTTNTANGDPIPCEQIRQDYNNLIRANWKTSLHASGFVDMGADANMGRMTGIGSSNQTYYTADNCHPNATGYGVIANKTYNVLSTVTSGGTYGNESSPIATSLSNIAVSSGTLTPTFSANTLEYRDSVTVSPITINGTSYSLVDGSNYIMLQSSAGNGINYKTYSVTVVKSGGSAVNMAFSQGTGVTVSGNTVTTSAGNGGATGTVSLQPGGYAKMQLNTILSNSQGVALVADTINNGSYSWPDYSSIALAYEYNGNLAGGKAASANFYGAAIGNMWIRLVRSADGKTMTMQKSTDDVTYTTYVTNTNVVNSATNVYLKIIFGGSTAGCSAINCKIYNP